MSHDLNRHIRKEATINFVVNLALNGGIAYALLKNQESLSMWGEHGFGPDLIATGLLLAGIIAAILVPMHRKKVAKGAMDAHGWQIEGRWPALLQRLPKGNFAMATCFGLFGALLVAPLTLAMLLVTGFTTFEPLDYAIFKGVWAGSLAAFLMRPLILLGTAHAPTAQGSAA